MRATPRRLAVFLASTFRDLDRERDLIHTVVIPEINHEATRRGWAVHPYAVDLRWGVDTKPQHTPEERQTEILRSCLDGVRRSDLMICLAGTRHGWAPGPTVVGSASTYPGNSGLTVTELEVMTFLDEVGPDRSITMRQESTPELKLLDLIGGRGGEIVTYSRPDSDFAPRLAREVLARLEKLLPDLDDPWDIEVAEHHTAALREAVMSVEGDAAPDLDQAINIDWRYLADARSTLQDEFSDLQDTFVMEGSVDNPAGPYLASFFTEPGRLRVKSGGVV